LDCNLSIINKGKQLENIEQCVIMMLPDRQYIQVSIWISLTFHQIFIYLFDYELWDVFLTEEKDKKEIVHGYMVGSQSLLNLSFIDIW
jgi:hypothetical protein